MGLELTTDRYPLITSQTLYQLHHATLWYFNTLFEIAMNELSSGYLKCLCVKKDNNLFSLILFLFLLET